MMKHFKGIKKITFVATVAFLFLLTATTGTVKAITLPAITVEEQEKQPTKPSIQPMTDEEKLENDKTKTN